MSYRVEFKTEINDLELFKKVCGWNNVDFDIDTREVSEKGTFLGRLNKKDDKDAGYSFVTDSDYVGNNRLRSQFTNLNNVMKDYSEQLCYKLGSVIDKKVTERGIVLRIAVNG